MRAFWGAVPPRNEDFVGRAGLLDSIRFTGAQPTVVLRGAEGVGKTQVAIEYAYRHAADYELVWWIAADQPVQIRIALAELAMRLRQLVVPDLRAALAAVRATEPDQRWLLIFDNAGLPGQVLPFLPIGSAHVLVTTRDPDWPGAVEVDVFTRDESKQLLRQRSDADRLAAAMGDLPLAVAACAASAADDYLRLLEENLATPGKSVPSPVAAALAVSLSGLRARNPGAYDLLRVCAFLAPEYRNHPAVALPSTPDLRPLHLHSLMQSAVRDQLTEAEQDECRHMAHMVLALADRSDAKSHAALICHVLASRAADCPDPHVRRLVTDTGELLRSWGDPDETIALNLGRPNAAYRLRLNGDFRSALDLDEQAYTQVRAQHGDHEPAALVAADDFALSLRLCGAVDAARRLDEQTWNRKTDVFGHDHRQSLLTLANWAADVLACGDWREALRMQQRVHRLYGEAFGVWHPLTLIASRNLAVAQRRTGDPAGALPLGQAALDKLVSCHGEDHLDAMSAAMSVSVNLRQLGKLEEARRLGVHIHERYEQVLGARHPFTFAAATNLAVTLHALGELSTARGLNEKALNGMRASLGRDHPFSVVCAINLANDLARGGRYDLARDLGVVTLDRARATLPENHPWTLAAATNLALDMRGVGQLDESDELQLDTLTRLSRTLGAYHPMTSGAYDNLRAFGDIDVPRI